MSAGDDPAKPHRAGVIDIGSNSVRLVIFQIDGAAMLPTFNEKVMAALGRGLSETGRLSVEGRALALAALRRFRAILTALDVRDVRAVATAAVRVAEDGGAFAREAALAGGVELSILSGADEGALSARGVEAGVFRPDGMMADLGGSSLELHAVGERELFSGETHMLGPLSLEALTGASASKIRSTIAKGLKTSEAVRTGTARIYAVGGAWRALAKVDMRRLDYPLQVLHGYRLSAEAVAETTRLIFDQRKSAGLADIAGRRAAQLHLSAAVLDELVQRSGASEVIISSYGLREGVISELTHQNGRDGLLDGCAAFAALNRYQIAFGQGLYDFVEPLFAHPRTPRWSKGESRLARAACLLADSAARFHPDHRAELAFDQALRAPISGVDHRERAYVAAAVGARYSRRCRLPAAYDALLDGAGAERAFQLGQAMRLGAAFSGRAADILARAGLSATPTRLVLELSSDHGALVSETVERRLAQTASAMGLKPQVRLR